MLTANRITLKCSATTRPQDLAGAVAKYITQDHQDNIEVVCVGAGAINQAIKSLIIARRFVTSSNVDLTFAPSFRPLTINEKEITGIVLTLVVEYVIV